ncbi:hypothetical protein ACFLU5_02825 [Bacteroidota bacterium]
MKIRRHILAFLFLCLATVGSFGQDYQYGREISWGITKATNSGLIGGVIGKYSIQKNDYVYHFFGFEIVNIKHPKEERYYSYTGNTYIYGKANYLYSFRTQYGRELSIFKKAPQQGVQIHGILAGGPSFGVIAPYYIEYYLNEQVIRVQYDPDIHDDQNSILGTGNLLQGVGESELTIGLNVKSSLTFEFGSIKSSVVGIETGLMFEVFTKEVPIIPTAETSSYFPSAFISLYYGTRR